MKKRLFSILLALCMVLCLVPTTAFAESETEEPPVCSCETACTAEAMNADCPICGAEGALPENCAKCAQPADDAAVQPEGEVSDPQPEGEVSDPQPEGKVSDPQPEGKVSDPQPEGEVSDPQPEGKVSDPQPETALTSLIGGNETAKDVSTAEELTAAIADVNFDTVRLTGDISISSTLTVNRPDVTLDLNGYTLTCGDTECDDIFSVNEHGNLTVKDSGTGGKIDGQNNNCGFSINGGILTLKSGTIINCMTDGDGGAVDISDGGKFEMSGGAITNCKASDDSGAVDIGDGCTFIMNSGTISGCRADDDAGAIFIKGNASFLMNGGTIENCSAGNYGGAVKIRNTSRFTMNGGTISSCTAQQGGGVYVDGSSTFTMNDGSIASCTAVNGGNSVFVVKPSASFTMTGGTVDGSIALPYKVGNNTVYMDGLGTAAYPYQISTADQLKLFRDIVNGAGGQTQNCGAYAVLTADIDLNNEPWTPIGPDRDSAYTGTFDGQGHTVKNLSVTVNVQPGRAGLFGCVKDGTIRKLTVAGSVSCTANQGWCGGIAGYAMDETIENCASLCTVSCTGIDARVGGIVGLVDYNSRTLIIRDCYNIGKITDRSDNGSGDAGGICGFYMNGKISNCYNVGEITGSGYVSKIAVSAYNDSRPTNCYYLSDTDTDLNGTAKTAAEFANGDVLDELKAGRDNSPWDSCQYVAAAKITLPVFKGQGDAHDHQSNDWKSNETEHWQVCTCGAVFHKAEHSGGTATCTEKAKCAVCGAEYGDVLGHDFTTSWTHDDNEHWKQCSRCDEKDDVGPHTWNSGTVTTAPTCTKAGEKTYSCNKCGATKIEPIPATGHSWKSDWTSDATHHWHECANDNCDVTDNAGKNGYAEHSGGKATCTQNAVCEFCKASYGSLDPNNHTDLKHIDAKAATAAEEGNIAYWYCDGCKKYFSDAAATKEITKAATVTAKLPPKITAGDGAAVTQGEKKELTFTSDASFADFVRVELDGTALEEKNYTKREGSTIITLNRDFVAALSVGEHTLAIVSQHGTATAKFTVKAKPTETATPQPTVPPQPTAQPTPTVQPQPTVQPVSPILRTGDTANPALWFALLIVSGGAAIGITVASRKKKHNK
ncbi:pectate lyase-like adhesive domain-containing protein [Neglectibacter sp. CSJ-5]|uniref:pectate lyase-like adhesive domain-containing protein n=1 Tax=Neglectibacter sp. CSJ-5 TaxID=3078043 RepID=UPI00292E8477|nr:pectate lyase-like adhesive domain-containing protein [Neglectibacter sp. CSJ-5]